MQDHLPERAIAAALRGDWEKAIELNKQILIQSKNDTDALNRLARAYAETGQFSLAIKTAKQAIKIDPLNSIARRCIHKWINGKGKPKKTSICKPVTFLEEPGKTKVISLTHLGDLNVLRGIDCGDEVQLCTHVHRISVNTTSGEYIGRLPDDISSRLIRLISNGNKYAAWAKSVQENRITIFIKEISRSEKLELEQSFTIERVSNLSDSY